MAKQDIQADVQEELTTRDRLGVAVRRFVSAVTKAQADRAEGTVGVEIQVFGATKLGNVTVTTRRHNE